MKRRNIAIMAMLALTAGQAFAQRCLPQMKGIEVKVGMADGVYNGKKSCKAGYYAGLGLSSYTKGGDKWTYGAEYLQVHQPYRETSVPMAQMTGEFGYSYNFLSDNSKTVLFYIGGTALAGYESVNWGKRTMSDGATLQNKGAFIYGGVGFKKLIVIQRSRNYGLGEEGNIMTLRKEIFSKYESVISSEDDNEFSPNFLVYMNQ